MPRLTTSRRTFLAGSAAAVAVPYFAWQPRTLTAETRSPTDRIALGLIGAGGIGQILFDSLNSFAYSRVSAIAVVIVVAVTLIDLLSQAIRSRLL